MFKLLKNLIKEPMFVIGSVLFLTTILAGLFGPFLYVSMPEGATYEAPSATYLLGTDNLGQDYVALLLKGLQNSLYVGFMAGIIATTVGTLIGLFGGFKGGIVDDILNMFTNLFIVIPSFVVLVLVSASWPEGRSLTLIAVLIGLTTWPWTARSVRAQAASLRGRDHISLARINGATNLEIIFKHILPYLASYVFMVFIMQVASGILSESAISMIGLGPIGEGSTSLGVILNTAKNNSAITDGYWWGIFPAAIVITMIVFALYLLNNSMEGVFNPRLRK
ncbi:MAG: ABC transporter permease [Fibromonadaceae bacterium]|jgi:peptide/nickel transport system permease protein|nr:ABC transporter permease [Fibromonadaceae bacterium]